jgi:signal transduction histidine kinase
MASAINSNRSALCSFDRLASSIRRSIGCGIDVPLLAFALPTFGQTAWHEGLRSARALERRTIAAFERAANRIVRQGDLLAHDPGSDRFAIAMLSPSRASRRPQSHEIRATLERIAAAMSLETGLPMERGWLTVFQAFATDELAEMVSDALERGARDRERSAVLATVGHELRTPLTSIRGYIETLLEGEPLPARTKRRFLETARRQTLRLGRLVDGMLAFSMLDLSLPDGECSCAIAEQLNAAVDAIVPLARRRRARIRLHGRVPRVRARIDEDACTHALLNLLENAVKHGRDGGEIRVSCVRRDDVVMVAIEDDGPGIPPSERHAIFGMGVRGQGVSPSGRGIGLAIVKAIVQRSGGSVTAAASPLGGARFELLLPVAEEGDPAAMS